MEPRKLPTSALIVELALCQASGDDQALDLVGALEDLHDLLLVGGDLM